MSKYKNEDILYIYIRALHEAIKIKPCLKGVTFCGESKAPNAKCDISIFIALAIPQSYYRQVSNIRPALVGNKIVDHSDAVGASPVVAPTTSSFST